MLRAYFTPTSLRVTGHAGADEAGRDVVCAAVTSAVRLAECVINDAMRQNARVEVSRKKADIALVLPADADESAKMVIEGARLYFMQLAREYPEFVGVISN